MPEAISPISVACPAEIAKIQRQTVNKERWKDPVYRAIVAKRIEGQTCEYCGNEPAVTVHHDEDWMYRTKDAYYDPANMTPMGNRCHYAYRRNLVICPVCREHYMRPTSEKCQHCRGEIRTSREGRIYKSSITKKRHPCGNHARFQVCKLHRICTFSPKRARECKEFKECEKR